MDAMVVVQGIGSSCCSRKKMQKKKKYKKLVAKRRPARPKIGAQKPTCALFQTICHQNLTLI